MARFCHVAEFAKRCLFCARCAAFVKRRAGSRPCDFAYRCAAELEAREKVAVTAQSSDRPADPEEDIAPVELHNLDEFTSISCELKAADQAAKEAASAHRVAQRRQALRAARQQRRQAS